MRRPLPGRNPVSWRNRVSGGATGPLPTHGSVPDRPADPAGPPPEQVGRYRILSRVGAGGMGTVCKAHDPQLDRPVALKVPHLHPRRDPAAAVARFLREAHADVGKELRRRVWERLEKHLAGATTVLVAPDGYLARLPLAA